MHWADTSFLYAVFAASDGNHQRAQALWRTLLQKRVPLIISDLVFSELGTLIAYRFGVTISARHMQLVSESHLLQRVYVDRKVENGALNWWITCDCVSFQFMRMLGIRRALSYDTDFSIAGFETVTEPGQMSDY
jgi:predicted nucleic acid-binding protein